MDDLNEQIDTAAADQAAEEAAFNAAFDSPDARPSPVEPAPVEPKPEEPAVEPEPTEQAPDPYAGLPEPVRRALAAIPTLEDQLRRTTGQVRSLQSAHDKAVAEAARVAASVPVPRSEAHERVAAELPEVLTTIEEILDQRMKQRETAAPAPEPVDTRLPDEIRLDEGFPQWREIAAGNDFKAWAAAQRDAQVIQSTTDMVTFMGAITRFESHKAAQSAIAQEAQRQAALRNSRIDASLTPSRGSGRRPLTTPQTEEEGFASAWDE